jgi:hypothetical protein
MEEKVEKRISTNFLRNSRIDRIGRVLIQLSNPINSDTGYSASNDEAVSFPEIFLGLNKFPKKLLPILKSYQSFNFSRKI